MLRQKNAENETSKIVENSRQKFHNRSVKVCVKIEVKVGVDIATLILLMSF